jgi:hypothetical protein
MVNPRDNLESDQTARRGFGTHYRDHEIFCCRRHWSEDLYDYQKRLPITAGQVLRIAKMPPRPRRCNNSTHLSCLAAIVSSR